MRTAIPESRKKSGSYLSGVLSKTSGERVIRLRRGPDYISPRHTAIPQVRSGLTFKPFSVGERWDGSRRIEDWLDQANVWSDNPVHAFDFPLRYRLGDLCQFYGFSLRQLAAPGTILSDRASAVTFVCIRPVHGSDASYLDSSHENAISHPPREVELG
jgi:hypothetical protein